MCPSDLGHPEEKMGPCPIRGHWKCSLQTDTAPKHPLVFEGKGTGHAFDLWVRTVEGKTSVLEVFLRLCCEQFTTDPPRQLPPQLLMALNHVAKPSEGGGGGGRFLEVIASVQGKSRRGITSHRVPPRRGGDGTFASNPAP